MFSSCFEVKPIIEESLKCLDHGEKVNDLSFLGNKAPRTNCFARHYKSRNRKTVFDVTYDFDEWGMRRIPTPEKATSHLILYGGSNVFGEGVDTGKHLSALAAEKYKKTVVKDLSYRGYGPYQAATLLERYPIRDWIQAEKGQFVFVFYQHHLWRFFLEPSYLSWSQGHAPIWVENKNGDWKEAGLIYEYLNQKEFPVVERLKLRSTQRLKLLVLLALFLFKKEISLHFSRRGIYFCNSPILSRGVDSESGSFKGSTPRCRFQNGCGHFPSLSRGSK